MMTMIDKFITLWIKEKSHRTIWLLISSIILMCWTILDSSFDLTKSFPQLTPSILGKTYISVLLVSIGLIASIVVLIKKPNIKSYDIINPPGFLKHKKTRRYYCQSCLIDKRICSELSIISLKEFQCRICKETYTVDYPVLLNHSYLSIAQDNDPLFKTHNRAVNELILKKQDGQPNA